MTDGLAVSPEWAWGGATGSGVRVCIVDSGVVSGHPAVGRVHGSFTVEADGVEPCVVECEPEDLSGHGTACAGIIRGLAPECELYSVRVLGKNVSGSGNALLAGLRWAIEQKYDIVSLSLSTTHLRFVSELRGLADDAYFGRTVLVTSAHNRTVESFPWRFSSVISVGSHQEDDSELFLANPRPPVDFFAPGQNISVAWFRGGRVNMTGNSFATPVIAGLCARILSKHPALTVTQLKSILYTTAANVFSAHEVTHA
ncbi:S8 family serine peptidase [Streptomyces sp. NPDC096354]|uniref:S8 family serine peptidase n=1 Tax=Streptomyces sp. NPDC096354 TaxID=3366088 RepID=UPI00382794E8